MPLTAGSLSQVAVTAVSDSLLSTVATGGTTPYAYQWYRDVVTNFVPAGSNSIAGATALSLTDSGLTPSTVYYYKVIATDSAGTPASVTTSQLVVTTLASTPNLPITNVVTISVATQQTGLGQYNTSNLAIFTNDSPGGGFGSLGYKIYLAPSEVGTDFGTGSNTFAMANAVFSQQPNILNNNGYLVVIPLLMSEQVAAAVTRTAGLIQYFGIMPTYEMGAVEMAAAAAVVQPLNKMLFCLGSGEGDVLAGGKLFLLQSGSLTKSRGLYYGGVAANSSNPLVFVASYAGRGLSVNFNGSNTTQTMHMKTLTGVQPDPSMSQSLLVLCETAGADVYASFEGVPKVFCTGANDFFDNVYNLGWFVGALQVAGFNALATTNTKVPQTENGMNVLKGAYRSVCEQAVTNQYVAPGSWNSPDTFGNQADLLLNVSQRGYYIYSQPVSQQLQSVRVTRAAPLCQIAIKLAGAIQSSNVVVFVNP